MLCTLHSSKRIAPRLEVLDRTYSDGVAALSRHPSGCIRRACHEGSPTRPRPTWPVRACAVPRPRCETP
eukprot:scaffold1085_cov407-Prasinococcus_capsulatus_cf.AAC.43